MPRRIDSNFGEPAMKRPMMTVLDTLKVSAHFIGGPTLVSCELGDIVPVSVVRIDQDHSVVSSAASQRTGPRVQHAVHRFVIPLLVIFFVSPLQRVVSIVA